MALFSRLKIKNDAVSGLDTPATLEKLYPETLNICRSELGSLDVFRKNVLAARLRAMPESCGRMISLRQESRDALRLVT